MRLWYCTNMKLLWTYIICITNLNRINNFWNNNNNNIFLLKNQKEYININKEINK